MNAWTERKRPASDQVSREIDEPFHRGLRDLECGRRPGLFGSRSVLEIEVFPHLGTERRELGESGEIGREIVFRSSSVIEIRGPKDDSDVDPVLRVMGVLTVLQ